LGAKGEKSVVTTSRRDDIRAEQAQDAEVLLDEIRDVLGEHDCTASLTALGVAVVEVLRRLPPHARVPVAQRWSARLLHTTQLTLPEQRPGAVATRMH
jgi:hypothetical protein